MIGNKRGLSTIVVTLIIIVLSLVAVGVVWVVVSNLLNTGTQQANFQFGTLFLSLKIEKVLTDANGNLFVTVSRGSGQGDLKEIDFIVSDGKNSQVVKKSTTLSELGTSTFTLTPADLTGLLTVSEIDIAPVINSGGSNQVGSKVDSKKTDYSSCSAILNSGNSNGDGIYTIDPDGFGSAESLQVYCDMTTDGGGWTLVDNDASNSATFTSRQLGANSDITVTRGSYLPSYTWSITPQLLCKSSYYTGVSNWVTFNALDAIALEYPTITTPGDSYSGHQGDWEIAKLNGNTNQGLGSWIYIGSGRIGSVWIGNGGAPTCACDYTGSSSGLGAWISSSSSTCSTWVR